jgi:hypothetical protein
MQVDPYKEAAFRFTAADGIEHSVWSPTGTETGSAVGRPVQVRYDPADPARARVAPPAGPPFLFFAAGDTMLIAGILLLVL